MNNQLNELLYPRQINVSIVLLAYPSDADSSNQRCIFEGTE